MNGILKISRRARLAVLAAAVATGSMGAVALADNTVADGDGVTPVANNNLALGTIPCGADTTRTVPVAVQRNGAAGSTNVFKNGSTAVVSVLSATGAGVTAAVPASPDNEISIPSTWGAQANNTMTTDTVAATVTVHPTAAGPGSGNVTFRAAGVNTSNATIARDDSMDVTWTASGCDSTAPTSSASAKKADDSAYTFGDWTNQDVTVSLSAQDNSGGSGVREIRYTLDGSMPTASAGTVYGSPFTITAEGTTAVKWVAIDNAGNVESPVHGADVNIDKTAPSISCGAADGDWHASDVSIACTANGGPSGFADPSDASFSLVTNVPAGSETSDASTNSRAVADGAGNSATAGPIAGNKVDQKVPEVSCDTADGDWHASDVSIACTATDGGSGVDPASDAGFSLATSVPAGTETADAETGSRSVTDAVGNSATAGPIGGNKVDKKGPVVSCGSPAPSFLLNQSPATVAGTFTDGGSGPASGNTSAAADTSTVGAAKTVLLSAQDAVGNNGSASCAYSVSYQFAGFYQPVDNNALNSMKAGSTAPIKWRLTDANGAYVTSLAAVTKTLSGVMSCSSTTPVDNLEEYATGGTTLRYDSTANQYVYNWQSPRQPGACYQVKIVFADGSEKVARFQLR